MPEKNSPPENNPVPDDLKLGVKAFSVICRMNNQKDLAGIFAVVADAIEKDTLSDLALNISIFAKRNGLDTKLKGGIF
jgi:hypothetical protein